MRPNETQRNWFEKLNCSRNRGYNYSVQLERNQKRLLVRVVGRFTEKNREFEKSGFLRILLSLFYQFIPLCTAGNIFGHFCTDWEKSFALL